MCLLSIDYFCLKVKFTYNMSLNINSKDGAVASLEHDAREWITEYMKWERDDINGYSLDEYCDELLEKYIKQLSWNSIKLVIKEIVESYWEEDSQ